MLTYTNLVSIDIHTGDTLGATSITVENGRIVELGKRSSGETRDLQGLFVVPGLIDMHAHLVWDGQADPDLITQRESAALAVLRAARNARRSLEGGVTTLRDLGAPHDAVIGVARGIQQGLLIGARVLAAGRPIIQTGGHISSQGREADGPSEVRKAVREQIKLGADLIKLMCSGGAYGEHEDISDTQFTLEEIKAAVETAHAAGKSVAAHALPAAAIRNALLAGVDTIEHAALPGEEEFELLQQQRVTVVPTLSPYYGMSLCGPNDGVPLAAVNKSRRIMEAYASNLARFLHDGVLVSLGTDAGSPNLTHPAVPHEINLWIDVAGIAPLQALQAATLFAARTLGRPDLGDLREGAQADLVGYQHHPLVQPTTLFKPLFVAKAGNDIRSAPPAFAAPFSFGGTL